MRILVVCGAGASSTFVAQRLRRAADALGVDVQAEAVPRSMLSARLADADTVLIGPHLPDADTVRAQAADHGATSLVLPADVFADTDGTRILRLIHPVSKGTS